MTIVRAAGIPRFPYSKLTYHKSGDEAEMRQQVDLNWKRILPRW